MLTVQMQCYGQEKRICNRKLPNDKMIVTCNGIGEQGLAATRRSVKQNSSSRRNSDVLVDLRMLEVDEEFADLEKNFFEPTELRKGYFGFLDFEFRTFLSS